MPATREASTDKSFRRGRKEMRSQPLIGTVPLTPGATYAHHLCFTLTKSVMAVLVNTDL